jgi:hypothetical protein
MSESRWGLICGNFILTHHFDAYEKKLCHKMWWNFFRPAIASR